MPPKSVPKLTKKQLQELQKEEMKKKELEDIEKKRIEDQKMIESKRLQMIENEKKKEQERIRIMQEKHTKGPGIEETIKRQRQANEKLRQSQEWSNFTTEYYKSYQTKESKLSTFITIFQEQAFVSPEKTLQSCEEGETYIERIHELMLKNRSEHNSIGQLQCLNAITKIREIQMKKLEHIMVNLANIAEQIEEKNNQINKNKGQANKTKSDGKITQYRHFLTKNFKIGMFLNSNTVRGNYKFKPIEIKEFGHNTEIPIKWAGINSIVKFQWISFNPYSPLVYEPFIIIGGVYNLQFYQLLMGSKKIKNFAVKKYYKGNQILNKFKLLPSASKQPFHVVYQIPKYVFLPSDDKNLIKMAQYDSINSKWQLLPPDAILEYELPEKKVKCRVLRPEPIAFVQDRCLDYPYVSWELRTIQRGTVHLDIQLNRQLPQNKQDFTNHRLMIKFEIQSSSVRVIMDKNYPELKEICELVDTPEIILQKLSRIGIHLLPVDEDYVGAKIQPKDREAEKSAIRDIAYAVESFYVRSVPNNTKFIDAKLRENLEYQSVFLEDQEKDWKLIRWAEGDKCEVRNRKIEERHLNLQTLLQNHRFTHEECVERIKYDRQYLLRTTIIKMLELTRILSFITSEPQESSLLQVLKSKVIIK